MNRRFDLARIVSDTKIKSSDILCSKCKYIVTVKTATCNKFDELYCYTCYLQLHKHKCIICDQGVVIPDSTPYMPNIKVRCDVYGCDQIIPFENLEHHERTCPKLKIKCEQCGKEFLNEDKINHLNNECNKEIQCPNCNFKGMRHGGFDHKCDVVKCMNSIRECKLEDRCEITEQSLTEMINGVASKEDYEDLTKLIRSVGNLKEMMLEKYFKNNKKENNNISDFVTAGFDGQILLWKNNVIKSRINNSKEKIYCVISLGNNHIATGGTEKDVKLWNVDNGLMTATLKDAEGTVECLTQVDKIHLAAGSTDGIIRIWDIVSYNLVAQLKGHLDPVTCLRSSDGILFSGSVDGNIGVWKTTNEKPIEMIKVHNDWINCICVLPNNKIASGSSDKTITITSYETKRQLNVIYAHTTDVSSLTYIKDLDYLISASWDGDIKVWDYHFTECVLVISQAHSGKNVQSIEYLGNGCLVSTGWDCQVKIWDLSSKSAINMSNNFLPHNDKVYSVCLLK